MLQLLKFLAVTVLLAAFLGACATTKSDKIKCHKYLVIPPFHDDELASDAIATSWMSRVENKLKGCDAFIDYRVGKKATNFVNLDHALPLGERRLSESAWTALKGRSKATSVIDLNYKVKGVKLEVRPNVYALPDYSAVIKHPFPKLTVTKAPTQVKTQAASRFWSNLALDFIPNSVTFGTTTANLDNAHADGDEDDPYITDSEEQHGFLPPAISAFGFSNIKHPDGFSMFDYTTRLYGNSNFMLVDSTYYFSENVPEPIGDEPQTVVPDSTTYDLWLFAMGITVNGEISLFSPIGTTFLSIGFGPAFVTFKDSTGDNGTFPALMIRYVFGHRMFVSDQWFVQFTSEQISSQPNYVENATFKAETRIYGAASIGFFFPESRSLARSYF